MNEKRKIAETEILKIRVYEIMENLILHNNVDTFLMGSKSEFDRLCRKVISELKEKYTHIKRIYVRAEYEYISDDYEQYLLESCEETYVLGTEHKMIAHFMLRPQTVYKSGIIIK